MEAQAILNNFGILPEQNALEGAMWFSYVPQSISVTYANSYGRFSVKDNLCGYSFAATDASNPPDANYGNLIPLPSSAENTLFGTSNGIPPTSGVNLVNNAVGKEIRVSTPDQFLQGALCLREVATGRDPATGRLLPLQQELQTARVAVGVAEILASGRLHGTPTLIVTGRSDDILPPNFASRAYVGLNALADGNGSKLRYIEVTNAQHLDSLLSLSAYGFPQNYVPLHRYFVRRGAHTPTTTIRLPPSQVVHTTPRGTNLPPITAANVPPISFTPGANAITFNGRVLHIPE